MICNLRIHSPRIYDNRGLAQDVIATIPAMEAVPVVFTDNEAELAVGVSRAQGLQSVVGVRGAGKVELEVASLQHGIGRHGKTSHREAHVLIEKFQVLLKGILRAHHEPHFVDQSLLTNGCSQRRVAQVNGIERASEDSDTSSKASILVIDF